MASDKPARPTGVTILAVLCAIAVPLNLLGAILAMVALPFLLLFGGAWGALGLLLVPAFLVYGIACAVTSVGMFRGKRWGWHASLALIALGAAFQVVSIVGGEIVGGFVGLVVSAAVAWYLTQPRVQTWFGIAVAFPWNKPAVAA